MREDEYVYPERWWDVRGHAAADVARRDGIERELSLEVAEGHPLFGVAARAIAACFHCDDVVVGLGDGSFAVVHLVWQGPQRPPWPNTQPLADFKAVAVYVAEHAEL